jgi:hypothetical protein
MIYFENSLSKYTQKLTSFLCFLLCSVLYRNSRQLGTQLRLKALCQSFSSGSPGFNTEPVHVKFVADRMALRQYFRPQTLHDLSFVCHRNSYISAIEGIAK